MTRGADLAGNLNAQAEYSQAQPLFEKAVQITRRALGEAHPDTAVSYDNLACNLDDQADHAQARLQVSHSQRSPQARSRFSPHSQLIVIGGFPIAPIVGRIETSSTRC